MESIRKWVKNSSKYHYFIIVIMVIIVTGAGGQSSEQSELHEVRDKNFNVSVEHVVF